MTYRKGGAVQLEGPGAEKRGKEMTEQIGAIAQVPGGLEMLMTIAAEELGGPKGGQTKQLRLYNMGGEVHGYQQGGLSQIMDQAQNVQAAGRGDDEMLLHVSPEEYEALTGMWGEPDINPDTGIPEYGFLSKLWKGIKKTVKKIVKSPLFAFIAPIALNIFAPGLGSAIGGWLGATGKVAATIGNTIVRSGIGAISGGKAGAISGALSGLTSAGVGADIGKKLGLSGATARIAGDAIMGGVAGEGTGVGFKQGALGAGMQSLMGDPMRAMEEKLTGIGKDIFSPQGEFDVTPGSMTLDPSQQDPFGFGSETLPQTTLSGAVLDSGVGEVLDPSMWDRAKGWMGEHPWLTAGGAIAGAGALGLFDTPGEQGPPDFSAGLPPGFNDPLPNLSFDREQMPIQDYYNYGRGEDAGEALFFGNNAIPSTTPPGAGPQASAGPGPGGPGGPQPIRLKGIYDKLRIPKLQGEGWTYDESTETMYPPGSFGPVGQYAAMGGYVHGGYIDEYDQGGYAEYKLGGLVRKYQSGGHVRGPGTGRSDDIPAVLSDGEYVIDSESVALLGDGSTDAGARRLDEMREKLRKHKAKKLAKGGFSDEAREPMEYMAKGGRAKKKKSTREAKIAELMKKGLSRRNATDYADGFIKSKDGKMYNVRTNKVVEMQEGGYVPPDENPYKKGSARYKMWERKYGKKKEESKAKEKTDQLTTKETESLLAKARRWKSRTERELEKLGEKAEGGNVNRSGLLAIKRLASKLEFAITSGNKKRVKQIADQLKSLDGGGGIEGFAYGGLVRNLTDNDITNIADDLGGFKNDRAFMRKFKARIREESARRG